jgi:hypothetical protein
LLKIGSISTGEKNTKTAPKSTTATAPSPNQERGKRRISPIRIAAPAAVITIEIARPLPRSPAQPAQSWVESPTSRARCSATTPSGRSTTTSSTAKAAPAAAAATIGRRDPRSSARRNRRGGLNASRASVTPSIAIPPSASARCGPR